MARSNGPLRPSLDEVVARLERRFRDPLPGPEVQLRLVPEPRPGLGTSREAESEGHKAGVLILLYPKAGRPHLLLTRRTDRVLHHRGQISFPGGAWDPPETLRETAVREAREELGVELAGLRILGDLTPLYIPRSRFCVYPTAAVLPRGPDFRPQPDEVAEIIETPLERLLDPAALRTECWTWAGQPMRVPFYEDRGHKIWGATAMILAEFLALLEPAETAGLPDGLNPADR